MNMPQNQNLSETDESNTTTVQLSDNPDDCSFDDIFTSDQFTETPISEEEVLNYYTLLTDLNVELQIMFGLDNDEDEEGLKSVGFQFRFEGTPMQLIILPYESHNTIVSRYSMIRDLILTSDHPILGGNIPPELNQQEVSKITNSVMQRIDDKQLAYILASNRKKHLSLIDAHIASLQSSCSLPVHVSMDRIGPDYIGNSIVHRIYAPELTLEDLYYRVSSISSLQDAYITNMGSSYLSGGVSVPEDINSFEGKMRSQDQQQNPRNPGFQ